MLTFDKTFFKGETICDFYVEPMIKKAWASQLELLCQIIDVCNKYNLTYYSFWGTMLGAVRHKGFIPWDDDIDIVMMRKDYEKFLEVAPLEFPTKYVIISPYTEIEWMEPFARIANSHSINYSDDHLKAFHGFPFVSGIDIFPFDFVPDNSETNDFQIKCLNTVLSTRNMIIQNYDKPVSQCTNLNIINSNLAELEELFNFTFNREYHLDNQLLCLFDQVSASFGNVSDSSITCYADRIKMLNEKGRDFLFKKEWFNGFITIPFENIKINIPENFAECLSTCYGDNYMTPIICTDVHEYPFYKKQMEVLHEIGRYDEVMNAVKAFDNSYLT